MVPESKVLFRSASPHRRGPPLRDQLCSGGREGPRGAPFGAAAPGGAKRLWIDNGKVEEEEEEEEEKKMEKKKLQ